jgi:hypothetical protein
VILPGAGAFSFVDDRRSMTVWYHRPSLFSTHTPIVFVMHGVKRDADLYRDNWKGAAERLGFLLVCPQFSKEDYPRRRNYQLGNLVDRAGRPIPKERWAFSVIERLFDAVRDMTGNTSERYCIYGHSAGGQFVHRLVLFVPEARFAVAVAANTGVYTMPTFGGDVFPYGLRGSGITAELLERAFGRRLVVMLGEEDTDPQDPFLRRSRRARRQGRNRLERGQLFYATAEREAARMGTTLNWTLETVPGAAHFDELMMPAAAQALLRGRIPSRTGGGRHGRPPVLGTLAGG